LFSLIHPFAFHGGKPPNPHHRFAPHEMHKDE
jgi:hypothetical protein